MKDGENINPYNDFEKVEYWRCSKCGKSTVYKPEICTCRKAKDNVCIYKYKKDKYKNKFQAIQ